MPFTDQFSTVPSAGLQSISLVFGAASLAQGAISPPVLTQISASGLAGFDVINVDATLSEVHTAEIELTQHPVETGADITDHARQKPREIRIDGFITNSPLDGSVALALARAAPVLGIAVAAGSAISNLNQSLLNQVSVVRDAFDKLQKLHDSAALVQVFGPFRTYSNMIMVSLTVNREQQNGDALRFSATFREVFFVTSQTTNVMNVPSAQGALDMGSQAPTPGPAKLIKSGVDPLLTGARTIIGSANLNSWLPARQ